MKLKSAVFVAIALISSTNFAARSSTIPLDSITIAPGEQQTIPLDKLFTDVEYEVICKMKTTILSSNKLSHFQASCPVVSSIIVDKAWNKCTGILQKHWFNTEGSDVSITVLNNKSRVSIRNIDYTDTISVKCVAVVS